MYPHLFHGLRVRGVYFLSLDLLNLAIVLLGTMGCSAHDLSRALNCAYSPAIGIKRATTFPPSNALQRLV